MQNRNAKNVSVMPERCPKCQSRVIPDCHQRGERFIHGWKCIMCGETSDSYKENTKRCP